MRDQTIAGSVRGAVCLSTPFIRCRKRDLGPSGLLPIGLLVGVPAAFFLMSWIHKIFPGLPWQLGLVPVATLVAGCAVAFIEIRDWLLQRTFSTPNLAAAMAELAESLRFPILPPDSVLVVRAEGDEASAALARSQFFSLLLTVLSRAVGRIAVFGAWVSALNEKRSLKNRIAHGLLFGVPASALLFFALSWSENDLIFAAFAVLGAIGLCFILPKYFLPLPVSFEGLGSIFIAITGAPLLILVTLMTVATSPFGVDLALLASVFEINVETTPPGKVMTIELSAERAIGLWHSAAYESEEAFHEIASWIRSRRVV
jgi:hypothetical protein